MSIRDQFKRSVCGCKICRIGCYTKPGYLAVGDLELIVEHVKPADPQQFVLDNFVASQGALLGATVNGQQKLANVPSITPRQKADGKCVFLQADGKCDIHAVAPFGCAFFDTHMPDDVANERSVRSHNETIDDHAAGGPYSLQYSLLEAAGKRTTSLITRAMAYDQELRRLRREQAAVKIPKRTLKRK